MAFACSTVVLDAAALDRLADAFAEIAIEAGAEVMDVYAQGCSFTHKADSSPVCAADERAEVLILHRLAEAAPGIPVVAEEASARGERPDVGDTFILVDPLDGTREFMGRNGEFTVNIALVRDGVPCAGAVFAPALGRLWYAGTRAFVCAVPAGASLADARDRREMRVRPKPADGLTALASRSHCDTATEAFLDGLDVRERVSAGSSLKFCRIAEGAADVYPRFGPTMEWDTAAGDAVLRAAGGAVVSCDGGPLAYGKIGEDFRNGGFVAWGDVPAAVR